MSKIEVGEYVRTDNGEIHKVLETEKGSIKIKSQYKEWIGLCCIKKHSKQLIDLIEVGDVLEIRTGLYNSFKYFVENEDNLLLLKEQVKEFWDISIILTKEQFESNCYKVGGKDEQKIQRRITRTKNKTNMSNKWYIYNSI